MAGPMKGINLQADEFVEMVDKGGNLCRVPFGPRFHDGRGGAEGKVVAIHRLEAKGFVKPGTPEAEARIAKNRAAAKKPAEVKPAEVKPATK